MRELNLDEQYVIHLICVDINRTDRLRRNFLRFLSMP